MIKYHGTPIGGKNTDAAELLRGRHALVSHAHPEQLGIVLENCQSFILDNGAFSEWKKSGDEIDFDVENDETGLPEKYGFNFREKDLYPQLSIKSIEVDSSIASMADYALSQGIDYKTLKIFNPWLRDAYLSVGEGESYTFNIPTDTNLVKVYKQNYTDDSLLFGLDASYALPVDTLALVTDSISNSK